MAQILSQLQSQLAEYQALKEHLNIAAVGAPDPATKIGLNLKTSDSQSSGTDSNSSSRIRLLLSPPSPDRWLRLIYRRIHHCWRLRRLHFHNSDTTNHYLLIFQHLFLSFPLERSPACYSRHAISFSIGWVVKSGIPDSFLLCRSFLTISSREMIFAS